jgi:predicted transcriptional regulator
MRLNETDFRILTALGNGRNVASNIALEIDADRGYVNTRLRYLDDVALVERVGPHDASGLYELTERGRFAVSQRELYDAEPSTFVARLRSIPNAVEK